MSPGKSSPTVSLRSPSPAAARFLTFTQQNLAPFSWADRVRGFSKQESNSNKDSKDSTVVITSHADGAQKPSFPSPVHEEHQPNHDVTENDDSEGWEVVKKGRSRSKGSNLSTSSGSSLQNQKKSSVVLQGKSTSTSSAVVMSEGIKVQQNPQGTPTKDLKDDKNDNKTNTDSTTDSKQEKVSHTAGEDVSSQNLNTLKDSKERESNEKKTNPIGEHGDVPSTRSTKIDALSTHSSTIVEECPVYSLSEDEEDEQEFTESLFKSTNSYNMESIDLAFNLTEDELNMKEEQEKVSIIIGFR